MPINSAEESSNFEDSNHCRQFTTDKRYEDYYRFKQGQFYEGEFFRDSIHGQGTYTWRNVAVYEGGFYSNSKEGYASLSFADNSYFEGLFIKNQPFGPGILTHPNGRQDAGFWMGRKLIRLSRAVDFIIPRLAPTSAAKIKLLQFKRFLPLNEEFYDSTTNIMEKLCNLPMSFPTPYSNVIYDPRSTFFDRLCFDKAYFINVDELSNEFIKDPKDLENAIRESVDLRENEIQGENSGSVKEIKVPSHCLCSQDVFVMDYENLEEKADVCDRESSQGEFEMGILANLTKFGTIDGLNENDAKEDEEEAQDDQGKVDEGEDASKAPKILLWNRSELCKEILKQMFRYRAFEEKLNFNLAKLMLGARTAFRRTGEKEKQCLQLLKMCALGPSHAVKDLLCCYEVSQDLTDGRGNNSLMFAAATDQHETMDILLDYGVDVNNFNDEGLTPLNLCLLRRLALTNKICSWETAFLPQELDRSLFPDDIQEEEFYAFQSIPSLDRIFGDGMSIYDSETQIHENRFLALLPTDAFLRQSYQSLSARTQDFFDSLDAFNLSHITILDLLRSPKNYSLIAVSEEGEMQRVDKPSSFCSFPTIDPSQEIESSKTTPRINVKFVPKTNKREEFTKSVMKVNTDRYLFEFSIKKKPIVGGVKKEKERLSSLKGKSLKVQEKEKEKEKESEVDDTEEITDEELLRKVTEIDKTIEKLLKRGADPNISEVPKPSIHLGVYTKDLNVICTLLLYGASPNCQVYPNEGLLTPLHVLVLQKPSEKNVQICEMLLKFGANTELETSPDFAITEEEKLYLYPDCGRTPLQLLCMRPDVEYGDPFEYLIKIGLLLANVCDKKHFYNGHSCLTLAMLSGNLKLLKALLESNCFDPNDILENDRGTTLHVLVSTELQKITAYDNSIKMCDLLIAQGADPLKKFEYPEKLFGTCVDYGYREIEEEKKARKATVTARKDSKKSEKSSKERTPVRDYLKDHERVVDYVNKVATNMANNKEKDSLSSKKDGKAQLQAKNSDRGSERSGGDTGRKDKNKGKQNNLADSQEKGDISSTKSGSRKDLEKNKEDKTDFPKKLESTDKKENESKTKNNRINSEGKVDLKGEKPEKIEKAKKHKDINEDYKKQKEKKEVKETEKNKITDKHKVHALSSDKFNLKKDITAKGSQKTVCSKSQWSHTEAFPEQFRQALLQLYGSRIDFDVNELLMPYVVLRNGELYYRFHNKPSGQKEQYSLI